MNMLWINKRLGLCNNRVFAGIVVYLLCWGCLSQSIAMQVDTHVITNTTWSLQNSPITISDSIYIKHGAVLTIQPGVTIQGGNQRPSYIYLQGGTLIAKGTEDNQVVFSSVNIFPKQSDQPNIVIIDHAKFNQGCPFNHQNYSDYRYGYIELRNSTLDSISPIVFYSAYEWPSIIERNNFICSETQTYIELNHNVIFRNNNVYNAKITAGDDKVIILSNTFIWDKQPIDNSYSDESEISYNTFVDNTRSEFIRPLQDTTKNNEYKPDFSNNFWKIRDNVIGSNDIDVLDDFFFDQEDSKDIKGKIIIQPNTILTFPDLMTPILPESECIANAGDDQPGETDTQIKEGDTVTLNGETSVDKYHITSSYLWIQKSGPTVVLSDNTAMKPTFVAPVLPNHQSSIITFELTITDIYNRQNTDSVDIQVVDNGITFDPRNILYIETQPDEYVIGLYVNHGDLTRLENTDPEEFDTQTYIPSDMLYGIVDFDIKVGVSGDYATITFILPQIVDPKYGWYLFSEEKGWYLGSTKNKPIATFNPERNVLTLSLIDGGQGDNDGEANGIIKSTSGLGLPTLIQEFKSSKGGNGCFISTCCSYEKTWLTQVLHWLFF
ncbi:MAG: hypothetical protein HQK77_03505 [Desulfobacterales bacterium]|nr:hypothetical protein [Desulfobacterales bacterium]